MGSLICSLWTVLLLVTLLTNQSKAQNVVFDVSANPIVNLAASEYGEKDASVFSGGIEIGTPALTVAHAKKEPPGVLIYDRYESGRTSWHAMRLGPKYYWGTKSIFFLRGSFGMPFLGGFRAERSREKGWGVLAGARAGYKFLPFGRVIIEPFFEFAYAWSKVLEPDFTDTIALGVNVGFRLVNPEY